MDCGLGFLNYNGCWDDAAFAEEHGFSTAGFVDSPLLAADPFVCLGLAAKATSTIRIGTFLAIPSMRAAPTTASAIATVNSLAPGRVFLGIGSGYTGRDTFGLGPVPARKVSAYAREVRLLLDGGEAIHRDGDKESPIRLRHSPLAATDFEARVPVYVAADGPKMLKACGESGDGLIVTLKYANLLSNGPDVFSDALATVKAAAEEDGRSVENLYTMWSTAACVLEPGESAASPRALEAVGAHAMMAYHTYACHPEIGDHLPPPFRDRIEIYEKEVLSRLPVPRAKIYQEAHAGHLSHLLDGEAAVLTEEIVRMTTLTGTAEEIAGQLVSLEAVGLDNVSFWPPPHLTRDFVLSFERRVMPLMRAAELAPQ